jgi:rhodanese-related sulfurtransferase
VYAEAHIPGSLEIAFRDRFCVWLGWLAPGDASLLFVVDDDQPIEDVVGEAMLVGFERFAGVLEGGLEAWREEGLPVMSTPDLDGAEADERVAWGALVLDVREPSEVAAGTMPGAVPIPLGELAGRAAAELPKNAPIVTYCAAGERSVSAVSILEREGFTDVSNLRRGYDAWVARR